MCEVCVPQFFVRTTIILSVHETFIAIFPIAWHLVTTEKLFWWWCGAVVCCVVLVLFWCCSGAVVPSDGMFAGKM